jgi:uncharacterized protein YciI
MYVISLTFTCPLEQIEPIAPAHGAWLKTYYDKGVFLLSGRQVPWRGGMILAHGVDRPDLMRILDDDPFLRHGLATHDVVAFKPSRSDERLAFLLGG